MLAAVPIAWTARAGRAGLVAVGSVAIFAVAATTVRSPQLGCSLAIVGLVVAAYVGRPTAGLAALWVVWLLAPGVRRVLGLEFGYEAQDPLSVAPFVATAAIAVIAGLRTPLPRKVVVLLLAVLGGFVLGLPSGAASNPSAAAFALLAYGSAVGAFILGWREGREAVRSWTLSRALVIAVPPLAAYGLYQYFVSLPEWDRFWLSVVNFTSVGAPEEGKIRVFSTLNSPGLLANVLALALLLQLSRRRPSALSFAGVALAGLALALTYVRTAWIAFAVATAVLAFASRGRALPQILATTAALALAIVVLTLTGGTLEALSERVGTLGQLGTDVSAQQRQATPSELLPELAVRPFGFGLGSAGEASLRLASSTRLGAPDNGYLSMAYQLGLPGALLVVGGFLTAMWWGLRGAFRRRDPERVVISGLFAFFVISLIAGDQFYGFVGVILWFLAGACVSRSLAPPPAQP